MNEGKAYEILSEYLGTNYYIIGKYNTIDDIILFHVKENKYKDDKFVLPEAYGVDSSGKVLNWDEISKYLDEKEIG